MCFCYAKLQLRIAKGSVLEILRVLLMHNKILYFHFTIILFVSGLTSTIAQNRTVGLFLNDSSSYNGYTLFAPVAYVNTYLINNEGLLVHMWEGTHRPGLSAYLLENGNLLRTALINNNDFPGGGTGGLIQEYNWEGNKVWEYQYSTPEYHHHHDVERLPNGNTLLIAWERILFEEAVTEGRDPDLILEGELWVDHIVEVQPVDSNSGNIVWEWHVWDHLIQDYDSSRLNYGVVYEHPELINVNYVGNLPNSLRPDWNHINSVDYNEEFDQIILTVHHFGEIWIIDHSTTTQEAAGHTGGNSGKGGDLLYRWGNPQTYNRGDETDQKLFAQHDAYWIESGLPGEGNILIFNNGRERPGGDYSTVDELMTPVDQNGDYPLEQDSSFKPTDFVWTYSDPVPSNFFSPNVSGSQRQPNGNTLICSGTWGEYLEFTSDGELVWYYVNPVIVTGPMYYEDPIPLTQNATFRIYRYAPDYPGLDGRDLMPGDPVELTDPSDVGTNNDIIPEQFELHQNFPNPFNPSTRIEFAIPFEGLIKIIVYNIMGEKAGVLLEEEKPAGQYSVMFNGSNLPSGVYFYTLVAGDYTQTKKMVLVK
jgi:hypothetical protein